MYRYTQVTRLGKSSFFAVNGFIDMYGKVTTLTHSFAVTDINMYPLYENPILLQVLKYA